ncbi:hypothetical protein M436DRAFT_62032 [Aureobasidium namibiae CBS 147.97]|uniref:Uncharacterized protein n=1 Tax=Aureobasidium namibiae CBS 147.97 TaxID=1043004 RepID=A0A074WR92_9PEZI|nr:uncharacterized protein M436DRAFT_62032 [Aureobasidium namibiae CBS 147.97]KEQ75643.1 hypothetical protein M436DRAFT_62032 [Aureobasidium namibiae CBS 147.97]
MPSKKRKPPTQTQSTAHPETPYKRCNFTRTSGEQTSDHASFITLFCLSPVEVAENMFPEELLQKQIRVVVARHKKLRIMAMLQRLVVVSRGFRENLKAVSQELEKRIAKIGETIAQYESYVQTHSFLVKEMVREQRQREGGNVAEIGPALS